MQCTVLTGATLGATNASQLLQFPFFDLQAGGSVLLQGVAVGVSCADLQAVQQAACTSFSRQCILEVR